MGKRLRETERTYEAGDGAAEPDLSGLPAVASVRLLNPAEFDAVYFDTPDLALAARRITLRRRTGGDDAGWHLKLPTAQADTRTEVHAPLGRGRRTVPPALLAEVLVYTRGRPLVPVVRLRNHRERCQLLDADGTPLAEIAHDHVTAEYPDERDPLSWTETEVELLGGKPKLLDAVEERLTAAGYRRSAHPSKLLHALGDRVPPDPPAPPDTISTAGDAALTYLHEQVRAIAAYDPAVRRDEPDAVHQMRVATRRLRSAFKTYGRELDRAVTDPIGDELKWLAEVLGLERDREVLAERLAERGAELDPDLRTEQLCDRIRGPRADARSSARRQLLRQLCEERYFDLLDRLDALLAAPPLRDPAQRPAEEAVRRAVRRDHRRLARRVAESLALPPGTGRDLALHDARKAAKRARYAAESARPVLGKPAERHRARLAALQKLLGEHQDSVMCRAAIRRLADTARRADEDTFPYGALHQMERERAGAVEAALPKAWGETDRGPLAG
ncbi:CYTH and CHAD domain-containing protein [Streptomyces sp. RPT161]|uniref:CYTH and CHAD domain-containing protein n=1 Tax=Streptomyces sp. RPT161 TaxID=3015993 RepID=UPI0022B8EF70|nr:CYTH and CHAD domain-containing protein [Streptomyces sp. RPT161]